MDIQRKTTAKAASNTQTSIADNFPRLEHSTTQFPVSLGKAHKPSAPSLCLSKAALQMGSMLVWLNIDCSQPHRFCLLVGCLTSQQQASVSQGRIWSDNFTCCHTETEVADPTIYLTQSQYTDTRPTSPSADPTMPGAWQGSHWSANFEVTGMTWPRKNPSASGIRTRDLPLSRWTP